MGDSNYTITSAIAYGSGAPHLGQAYQYIFADATARFKRLDGYNVLFSSGMDENGMKVPTVAAEQGVTEVELIDRTAKQFQHLATLLGISWDRVVRTSGAVHMRVCNDVWNRMAGKGDIYLDGHQGAYSARTDVFHADGEIETRPDGVEVVASTGEVVTRFGRPVHFFRLSTYRDRLLALYERSPDFVGPPSRRAEIMAEISSGLSDIPISCPGVGWGVPVPGSNEYRMHVWFDALASYLTAVRAEHMPSTWPPDLQITSRGSIRFHGIHWPAFLMSAGLPMPARIFGHGFLLSGGERMSRSAGTLPDIVEVVSDCGVDATRFYALRHGDFGLDGEFSRAALVRLANRELADGLSDLTYRCLTWIAEQYDGRVPEPGALLEDDTALIEAAHGLLATCRSAYDTQTVSRAMESIVATISSAHEYFGKQASSASDRQRIGTFLYVTAEVLRIVGILLQPAVPETAGKLLQQLGQGATMRTLADLSTRIISGTRLPDPVVLFSRIG
ncbi:methionine--tRNA ligase [Nocardia cyriacigeorgica]|uniref:methionine--tRNA ligase n=1 Tax=Nocardia cyriacigeorgica TaxID=135487 RepID=UPI0018956D98|nr:methionine--tRNA ligase [Nocardia cyriacigeorgica]MBF6414574.1 methionine--tRNA ligase [Nocardia cyriacigeorgica]